MIQATGRGNVRVRTNTGETLTLLDVLHVPKLSTSLMSVAQIVKHGARLTTEAAILHVMLNDVHILFADCADGVFRTKLKPHRKRSTCHEATFNINSPPSTSTRKPNPKGIHIFGCMAIGLIPKPLRDTEFSLLPRHE